MVLVLLKRREDVMLCNEETVYLIKRRQEGLSLLSSLELKSSLVFLS